MNQRCSKILFLILGPLCLPGFAEGPALRGSAATEFLKEKGIYASLGEAVSAAMYGAHPDEHGFSASNPGQHFVAHFSGEGLAITGPDWGTRWSLRSAGYGDRQVIAEPAQLTAQGTRTELSHGRGVTEWYVNTVSGLEHGFTVQRPEVPRAGDRLRLILDVAGDLRPSGSGDGIGLLRADGSVALRYQHLLVIDAEGRTLPARMRAVAQSVWVDVDDEGAAWPVTVDPTFVQQALLVPPNQGPNDQFGYAVAVSGNTVLVGAPGTQAAYVFVRGGSSWVLQAQLKPNYYEGDPQFGYAVALDGDTAAIGAPHDIDNFLNIDTGSVFVFVRNGVTWTLQGAWVGDFSDRDGFGTSVALSGNTLIVGAPGEDSGAAGVNGDPSNDAAPESGAAYVYVRNGTTWTRQAYLKASNAGMGDHFGTSVAASGETVVIGAPHEDSSSTGVNGVDNNGAEESGATYVFTRNSGTWSQQVFLKASGAGTFTYFGHSVGISGNTIAVGAPGDAFGGGDVYAFVRDGSNWMEQFHLRKSQDAFGVSVSVSGNVMVVGLPYDQSASTGVDGDETNRGVWDAGAAFVYVRNGAAWSQTAYLKASDTARNSYFGVAVAVSGGTVVAGSLHGAAYVFHDPTVRITDVRSITDFGNGPGFTSGSWLQITGVNLAPRTRIWQVSDFNGNNAPVNLDNISVLFNGKFGFMHFTKPDDAFGPSQINVQAPGDLGDGPVNVQVLNHFAVSNIFTIQKTALAPGMLAPPKFIVGGKQYLAATYGTDYVFVGNQNLVPGAPFRPAKPGDILYLYGVGFGDTTPYFAPGLIPTVLTQLNAQIQFQFGPALVTPYYAGFYPNYIGLDLFGLVVPDVPDGDHLITVLVNGQPQAQTLYLTVKR